MHLSNEIYRSKVTHNSAAGFVWEKTEKCYFFDINHAKEVAAQL